MQRREVIASSSLFLLAGCMGNSTERPSTETITSNPETESTTTTTQTERRPSVENVNLVTEWEQFGDVQRNEIHGAGQGATIAIGYSYAVQIHDGVHDITKQVRIYDSEDNRVSQKSSEDRQLVDSSGYQEWEGAFYLDTVSWDLGDYVAEVIIRDNTGSTVSESVSGEFSLNSPLSGDEANLVEYSGPDSVNPDGTYSYSIELENASNRDSSIISPLSVRRNQGEWYTYDESQFRYTIPRGETRTWDSGELTAPSESGTYTYRIDDIGATWSVKVA